MKLSIVTTLYNSAPYLREFYQRCCQTAQTLTDDFEIIFVNDGSPDHSLQVAVDLHLEDARVCVVDLSRNFGHHRAIMRGLEQASGDLVFLIDCDLEENPELMQDFHQVMQTSESDVVYGIQSQRRDHWMNRIASRIFYGVFNLLSAYPIPRNLLTVRLMTRRYVDQLLCYREQSFVISVLWEMTGFKQVSVEVQKKYKGKTSYNLAKKVVYVIRSVTSSSNKPLIYIAFLGLIMTIPSFALMMYYLLRYFILGFGVPGWASLIISTWFIGGLNVLILGIIAIYLSVIFEEVKQRPYTVVRHIYRRDT